MSTPRTDALEEESRALEEVPARLFLLAHARQLETELAVCRVALAEQAIEEAMSCETGDGWWPDRAAKYHATAAYLRDTAQPLDVSRL